MGIFENIAMALAGLKANKMRAFLTMLGIIIGIGSVIAISTLGSIMEASVMDIFNSQGGANLMQVYINLKPDASREYYLEEDYLTEEMMDSMMERFPDEIECVIIQNGFTGGTMNIRRKEYEVSVYGVNAGYIRQSMTTVEAGRYITDKDCNEMRNICAISDRQAQKIFGSNRAALGKSITVTLNNGEMVDLTIVGVYKYQLTGIMSMAIGEGMDDWNSEIYMPYTTMARLMGQDSDTFFWFNINTMSGVQSEPFSKKLENYFNTTFYRDNDDIEVRVFTAETQMAMIGDVLGMLQLAISVIAGISLLVGGIGVMNIMLVSVTERTREIGVRKAMGAPNSAIRTQFIVESIIICLIGGALGILCGMGMGNIAGLIVGTTAPPSLGSILLAVGFSMAIGVFFGYYPANRAAKLDPIEALRYE